MPLRVIKIVEGTSVDGPGLRTSVYFAGCKHHCTGCHNPQSWDFNAGRDMTPEQIMEVIRFNGFNVTFSGGDPFYQPLDELVTLARMIREAGLCIWAYTGFLFEELISEQKYSQLLDLIDTVVDGPYIDALRDTSLHFRGSSNQRIIAVSEFRRMHLGLC